MLSSSFTSKVEDGVMAWVRLNDAWLRVKVLTATIRLEGVTNTVSDPKTGTEFTVPNSALRFGDRAPRRA